MRQTDIATIIAIVLVISGCWYMLVESPDWMYQENTHNKGE